MGTKRPPSAGRWLGGPRLQPLMRLQKLPRKREAQFEQCVRASWLTSCLCQPPTARLGAHLRKAYAQIKNLAGDLSVPPYLIDPARLILRRSAGVFRPAP